MNRQMKANGQGKATTVVTLLLCCFVTLAVVSCMSSKSASSSGKGGEVVGVSGKTFSEPSPYGMTKIGRGWLRMGIEQQDTLWGKQTPVRDVSVDGFWMDETEVTNSQYKQFVFWVRDSILRTRLADPNYGGDETYMITEEKGEEVTPHLNWKKPLPRKPNEDELRAIESLYVTNPVTGEKLLDYSQMNYRYEVYDYTTAALRRNRLNAEERNLNTDVNVNPNEVVMISKDTAYIDDEGRIVRQTINRPLSGPWDFLNTYIVNIYPDTTCWVNDFQNSDNEVYLRNYFSNPAYNDYPVVGVTWEQANAFCAWRTEYLLKGLGAEARYVQRYRLPTEAEWEFAARGKDQTEFPWENENVKNGDGCFYANFKPDRGNYTKDGNLITSKTGIYGANSNGLYDMAGNVAEWTNSAFDPTSYNFTWDLNPDYTYNAQDDDPPVMKRKVVRGGSWKDISYYIQVTSRDYEYQDTARSYIGFRTIQPYLGRNKGDNPKLSRVYR